MGSLAIALASGALLYRGVTVLPNSKEVVVKGKPIGFVQRAQNDVRSKSPLQLSWVPLTTHSPLYEGDSIFTGPNSNATVTIGKGISLELNSESLINVATDKENSGDGPGSFIHVPYGDIDLKLSGTPRIRVKSKDEVVLIKKPSSGPAQIKVRSNERIQMGVTSGVVQIQEKGQVRQLTASDALVTLGSQAQSPPSPVKEPSSSFQAEVPRLAPALRKTPLLKVVPLTPPPALPPSVPPPSESAVAKESSPMDLGPIKPPSKSDFIPKSLEPFQGVTLYFPRQEKLAVRFVWTKSPRNLRYQLQIAEDANYQKLILEKTLTTSEFLFVFPKPTGVFWRVRSFEREEAPSEWAESSSVQVRYAQ